MEKINIGEWKLGFLGLALCHISVLKKINILKTGSVFEIGIHNDSRFNDQTIVELVIIKKIIFNIIYIKIYFSK